MQIHKIENTKLISDLKELVKKEKEFTLKILQHLREVENRQLFVARGHSSLFKFCLAELKYSESEAQTRIQAMRLLKELPEMEQKIEAGEISRVRF